MTGFNCVITQDFLSFVTKGLQPSIDFEKDTKILFHISFILTTNLPLSARSRRGSAKRWGLLFCMVICLQDLNSEKGHL